MTVNHPHILLLAGTFEARQLARQLSDRLPHARITASFAGAVQDLPDLPVPARVGGFGGPEGLARYMADSGVSLLIDATHPFAARMSQHAAIAAQSLSCPLIRLERPGWVPKRGDNWIPAASFNEARHLLPDHARAFLAVGRKEIGQFADRTDVFALARMIEAPPVVLPDHCKLILSRPAQTVDEEVALFQAHGIDHIVCKNSGGMRSYAKIEAANRLQLPVIMIERPRLPEVPAAQSVQGLCDWVTEALKPTS
ncbi:cobalt-precorrin-6A reductase [Roseibium sp. RKSG952]|uniref:cobalt-precorrin-6A reductase n=1 Tax=Roseibium sp. RKSG952 TaxID=2529384 RepID=UPI0012BCE09C|nr:cobalt-precorrin-6A reductase [Roseibium sp. RKSG952]MTI00013.1 cobalt-precorrin-6A reductase [Roseibium sp. RKSG952]